MISSQTTAEIHRRLRRIEQLATEIEQVPNFGPDYWTMQKMDQKCQEIRQHCAWIDSHIGTGDE
jgi:cell fate (sporulation/competence/biofilm development) regulator YlbF (YheA/YmcA/DUF963 family)